MERGKVISYGTGLNHAEMWYDYLLSKGHDVANLNDLDFMTIVAKYETKHPFIVSNEDNS